MFLSFVHPSITRSSSYNCCIVLANGTVAASLCLDLVRYLARTPRYGTIVLCTTVEKPILRPRKCLILYIYLSTAVSICLSVYLPGHCLPTYLSIFCVCHTSTYSYSSTVLFTNMSKTLLSSAIQAITPTIPNRQHEFAQHQLL